jgi:hypothetical protein
VKQEAETSWVVIFDEISVFFNPRHKTRADERFFVKMAKLHRKFAIPTTAQDLCRIRLTKIDAQSNPNFPIVPSS